MPTMKRPAPTVGMTEPALTDLLGVALNHRCRTFDEQAAMLTAATKIDRRHGITDGNRGFVREVIDTYEPCGNCPNTATEDAVRDLNERYLW